MDNPNNQQPPMTPPQMPQQGGMMQAAQQGQSKSPQMTQQQFTSSHHHIYDTLRNTLMGLVKQGIPGMEEVLTALNKAHVSQMKNQQQSPQMPQQQPIPQAMGGVHPETGQLQKPPMMPQGGQ